MEKFPGGFPRYGKTGGRRLRWRRARVLQKEAEGFAGGAEAGGGDNGVEGAERRAQAAADVEVGGGHDGFGGFQGRFGAEHAADAAAGAALGEALAEETGEGAGVGVVEVGGDEAGGIEPPRGAEAGEDEWNLRLLRGEEEVGLGIEGVDGVDENVAGMVGEQLGRGLGVEKEGAGDDVGGRVDVAQKAGADVGLGLAERRMEGEGMAVEIGGADFVEIDEDEVADGGAGEGFGGGGADGAEAGDDDAGAGEAGQGGGSEEEFEAGERRGHGRRIEN